MVVDTDPVVRAASKGTPCVATRFSPETKGIDLFRSSGSSRSDRRNRPEEGLGLFEPMQPRLAPGPPILPPGQRTRWTGGGSKRHPIHVSMQVQETSHPSRPATELRPKTREHTVWWQRSQGRNPSTSIGTKKGRR